MRTKKKEQRAREKKIKELSLFVLLRQYFFIFIPSHSLTPVRTGHAITVRAHTPISLLMEQSV